VFSTSNEPDVFPLPKQAFVVPEPSDLRRLFPTCGERFVETRIYKYGCQQ
jgi:hypothetical protein